jgi:hypothetical protein
VTANAELAEQLRHQADEAMHRRKALLCASVAVATTATIPAAIRALREWNGPERIRQDAIDVIGHLASEAGQ